MRSDRLRGKNYPLVAILCGFEKSGTTVLNEVLRRHPSLDSGHEVGVLLESTPRKFSTVQPYFSFFRETWRITKDDALHCCDTDHWHAFYNRAREFSPVIADKSVEIFDKTPAYMRCLDAVMGRVPEVPCVVNVRDPRALMHSWACWSGYREKPARWVEENFESNVARFMEYAQGFRGAWLSGKHNLLVNQFETMCLDPYKQIKKIFRFLGKDFSSDYLHFESEHFVYGNTVSQDYIFSYLDDFHDSLSHKILNATAEFSEWHYHQ